MAIGTAAAIGLGIAGVSAAASAAGALKGPSKDTKTIGDQSAFGAQGQSMASAGMTSFQSMVDQGPGGADVAAGAGAQRDLASLLQQYQQSGGIPTSQDMSQAESFAGSMFGGRRNALRDSFREQSQQFNQQAALMGRSPLDPVMRNKLAQEQTRQSRQLDTEQGAFASQFAMQQPDRRLGFAQGRAQVMGGLASQAMANRQALFSMGQNALNSDNNLRMGQGSTTSSGGGQGAFNAITGGIAGAGAGMSLAKDFMGAMGSNGGNGRVAQTGQGGEGTWT